VAEISSLDPLHVFRFEVKFFEDPAETRAGQGAAGGAGGSGVPIARGLFSECTGLEATMEPQAIQEGGRNYGAVQRTGRVTFSTVILKRGVSKSQHLWQWFDFATRGKMYAHRLRVQIILMDNAGRPLLMWTLRNALPVKFKAPDLNATAGEIGIEELHLAHEALELATERELRIATLELE
jgi:phage tail-like protein